MAILVAGREEPKQGEHERFLTKPVGKPGCDGVTDFVRLELRRSGVRNQLVVVLGPFQIILETHGEVGDQLTLVPREPTKLRMGNV